MHKLPREFQLFLISVVVAGATMLWVVAPQIDIHAWRDLLLFMFLIGLATMFPIPDPRGGYITATPVLFYSLLSVHGPSAGAVAAFAYAVGASISAGWLPWRMVFNGAQMGLSVGLAGYLFRLVGGSTTKLDIGSFLLPLFLAALTHQTVNNFFVGFYYSRLRRSPFLSTWLSDIRDLLWSNILSIPTAALLTILYVSVHPGTLLLYLVSLPVQRWALQLYLQHRRINNQAIDSLVVAIDANFPQGRGHSRRVADLSVAIARQINLSDSAVEAIEMGALLHDVGLIGLDEVLDSGAVLDAGALQRLRDHARIGWEIAQELPRRDVAEIVLYHHERFDGTGYPLGLNGTHIPLGARIVALAEAFDSMTTGGLQGARALSPSDAIRKIQAEAGKAFDPTVTDALVAAWDTGMISATLASIAQQQDVTSNAKVPSHGF